MQPFLSARIIIRNRVYAMKKEQLLKRLESVGLPDMLVAGHKARLKQALVMGAPAVNYARKPYPQTGSIIEGLLSWFRGPTWRTALASSVSVIVLGLVLGVVVYFANPSPAVLAADLVKRDPGIQHKLSWTGEIIIVRVEIRDRMASVVCGRSMGDFIEADVDMDGRTVVNTRRFEGLFIPEISYEAQDSAIKVARSDPGVKAMLDKGAVIGRVFPVFSSIQGITIINGNLVKVTPATTQAVVPVILDGKAWLVQVNLQGEKVERIIEPQSRPSTYFDIFYMLKQT
jgi:hypothetical protein